MAIDFKVFLANRAKFPVEQLAPYGGGWVAWSRDGTGIIASSKESEEAVWKQLEDAGLDVSQHVHSYIPADNEVMYGFTSFRIERPLPNDDSSNK